MPSLSDIYNGEAKVTVTVNGVLLEVGYNPLVWTNANIKGIRRSNDKMDEEEKKLRTAADLSIDLFLKLITSWNLTDSNEVILPITREVLDNLPDALLDFIANAIIKDMNSPKNGQISKGS